MALKAKTGKSTGGGKAKAAPMHFEWRAANADAVGSVDAFEKTAQRVMAAIAELNDAMAEAHKCTEMRVEMWRENDELPSHYVYRIYRLTHAVTRVAFKAEIADKPGQLTEWWRSKYEPVPKPEVGAK